LSEFFRKSVRVQSPTALQEAYHKNHPSAFKILTTAEGSSQTPFSFHQHPKFYTQNFHRRASRFLKKGKKKVLWL
jgi:hypothetical protein